MWAPKVPYRGVLGGRGGGELSPSKMTMTSKGSKKYFSAFSRVPYRGGVYGGGSYKGGGCIFDKLGFQKETKHLSMPIVEWHPQHNTHSQTPMLHVSPHRFFCATIPPVSLNHCQDIIFSFFNLFCQRTLIEGNFTPVFQIFWVKEQIQAPVLLQDELMVFFGRGGVRGTEYPKRCLVFYVYSPFIIDFEFAKKAFRHSGYMKQQDAQIFLQRLKNTHVGPFISFISPPTLISPIGFPTERFLFRQGSCFGLDWPSQLWGRQNKVPLTLKEKAWKTNRKKCLPTKVPFFARLAAFFWIKKMPAGDFSEKSVLWVIFFHENLGFFDIFLFLLTKK